jgi:FkbM family methyltransferase
MRRFRQRRPTGRLEKLERRRLASLRRIVSAQSGLEKRLRKAQIALEEDPSGEALSDQSWVERLDYPAADVYLARVSKKSYYRAIHACRKEPFTVRWIEDVMAGQDSVLYDVGANVGAYSLLAARLGGHGARVFAFEPAYASYAVLCTNVLVNQASDRVVPMAITLGASTGMGTFRYNDLGGGEAGHGGGFDPDTDRVRPSHAEFRSYLDQAVPVYRLDDLILHLGISPPEHLKVDVDGGELAVLQGAAETLRHSVRSLMVEIGHSLAAPARKFLVERGFREVMTHKKGREKGELVCLFERG